MKPFTMDRQRARDGPVPTDSHPLSPPDTDISSQLDHYSTTTRRPSLAHPESAYTLPTIPATPEVGKESAGARFRRMAVPTIQRSNSREFAGRDLRGASRPQTRWLVVLMPPPHLTTELAVGHRSPGRIANGLLIPLFPTLFAQLTAIAKEFNFPSTTGLCLYLHLPDAPATPRITDDIWPILWARHLHADESSLPLGIPVAGRVEFDIDVPNARWYPMWFAHVSRQELVPDLARTIPTSPRALGREIMSPRAAKSVPRPLALVPRSEPVVQVETVPSPAPSPAPSPSGVVIPKSASKETVEKVRRWSALVTPDPALHSDAPVEPIAVVEEPTVLLSNNETLVPLSTEETPEDEPLNLEDFQWSISSAGPPSPVSSCAASTSSRVISIHMLERNEGSVLLTPTTATSWGPPTVSDVESELNLNLGWRVRSPDIGERAEGSVLLTPSTATSWGAPLSYPPTPAQWIAMQEFVRSPDLGERAEGSVLLTPSTATSWGAPLSYPPTPAQWHAMQQYVRSPDAGQRAEGSVLLTPSTATTWGAPETFPPTPKAWRERLRDGVTSPDMGARAEEEFERGRHSTMVWSGEVETEEEAYRRMGIPWVWEFGWPMMEGAELAVPEDEREVVEEDTQDRDVYGLEVEDVAPVVLVTGEDEPELEVGWPQFEHDEVDVSLDIEGHSALDEGQSAEFGVLGSEQAMDAFEFDAPRFEALPTDEEEVADDADDEDEVADTDIEAFEYELPHFELVEGDEDQVEREGPDTVTPDVFEYSLPEYELQPSPAHEVYAGFVESPMSMVTTRSVAVAVASISTSVLANTSVPTNTSTQIVQTRNYGAYPFLVLYPAVYPHLDLYPTAPAATAPAGRPALGLVTQIQTTVLTKSLSSLSPVESTPDVPSPVESIKSASPSVPSPASSRKPSLSVQVPRARSSTIVAVNPADGRSRAWSRALPPVPPVPREILEQSGSVEHTRSGSLERTAAAVPRRLGRMERKPSIVFDDTEFELLPSEKKPALSSAYPHRYPYNLAVLYPLGYPHNLESLYPSVVKAPESVPVSLVALVAPISGLQTKPVLALEQPDILLAFRPVVQARLKPYPVFDLYPAVYPHNLLELYPAVVPCAPAPVHVVSAKVVVKQQQILVALPEPPKVSRLNGIQVRLALQYPVLDLFPAVYPYNLGCIYPGVVNSRPTTGKEVAEVKVQAPELVQPSPEPLAETKVRLARVYPNIELYAPVYPFSLDIYPSKLVKDGVSVPVPPQSVEANAGSNITSQVVKPTIRTRKTHAQLCIEVLRKTHAQLVAEVTEIAAPAYVRKTHEQLQADVFPDGLPEPEPATVVLASLEVTVTPTLNIPTETEPVPQPTTAPLRRQRSGTIMMRGPPVPAEPMPSLPPLPPMPQGTDLSRSRSMLEARTQMFERPTTPTRAQTIGPPRSLRGKSAQFERAMSLFHAPEEPGKAASEGSMTPPRISRNISRLDMSKFKFA